MIRVLVLSVRRSSFLGVRHAAFEAEDGQRTVDGVEHPTCEAVCRALGLLTDECEAQELLEESARALDPPPTVRSLFARLTLENMARARRLCVRQHCRNGIGRRSMYPSVTYSDSIFGHGD